MHFVRICFTIFRHFKLFFCFLFWTVVLKRTTKREKKVHCLNSKTHEYFIRMGLMFNSIDVLARTTTIYLSYLFLYCSCESRNRNNKHKNWLSISLDFQFNFKMLEIQTNPIRMKIKSNQVHPNEISNDKSNQKQRKMKKKIEDGKMFHSLISIELLLLICWIPSLKQTKMVLQFKRRKKRFLFQKRNRWFAKSYDSI